MLSFDASLFAIAGAVAAAGPIVIHLLNRRRFRTVSWAAMDFLREALERNRKILHLRDIILLALRVLA
ncbi:MAG: BatA domain-containing protein, partial [Candidatus Saccharimonas sp.]|nr:BatA domain-containing protein [Planctomycetaceae bacterium]